MIAPHLEPRGLQPDATPISCDYPAASRKAAARGSQKLLDALLGASRPSPPVEVVRDTILTAPSLVMKAPSGTVTTIRFNNAGFLTTRQIQRTVAEFYRIPEAEMASPRKAKQFSHPRQVAYYLARELTAQSLPAIARRFGGRDHTTILHGIRQVERRIANDRDIAVEVEILRERLGG